MSSTSVDNTPSTDTIRNERCPTCDGVTTQRITIEIRTGEAGDAVRRGTEKYSRGPYRVTECLRCERSAATRIDNR
ncbi:hypothetical protein BRD01_10580 [Halobacteriales archaeon QS_8_65_32]|jgi:ribosomal protein L37AE/L43A|nr:MAG: hypothetical protein BRD01_10580 [Halobacteriales archaeon QS_8_65_32]